MDADEAPTSAPPAAAIAAVEKEELPTTPVNEDQATDENKVDDDAEAQELPAASDDDKAVNDDSNKDETVEDKVMAPKRKKASSVPRVEIPGERRSDRARQAPRSVYTTADETPSEVEFVVPVGPGTKLRDIDYLAEKVSKCGKRDAEVLKMLYQVMFSRRFSLGIMKDAKQHILDFSGYLPFDDDADKDKFRDDLAIKLCRATVGFVDVLMDFLQVDRSKKSFVDSGAQGGKDDKVERIIDWLFAPTPTEVTKAKKPSDVETATDDEDAIPSAATPKKPGKKKVPVSKKRKVVPTTSKKKKQVVAVAADDAETESENDFEEAARKAEAGLKKPTGKALPVDIQTRLKQIVTEGDVETLTLKTVER
ncbi:hypothetical protein B5M09_007930 [Aphanomyces astaci]|uniref:Uncharacterized protein n=1 Tax=Aphanomyces astaci TaxID=112090 RepID=A0A3R8DPG6_APHAT|nr:hypothetical protein B5M09_007930 [Aphanomyces astaci]